MSFLSKITDEEMRQLPLTSFNKDIYVIDNEESSKRACEYLRLQPLLGFDTETRPAFKKGVTHKVALLQLSTDKKAFLFRLNKIRLSAGIKKILSDSSIIKVGIAVRDDIIGLKKLSNFEARSFVELQEMVKKYGIQNLSLQKLSAIILGIYVSKSKRLSNWQSDTLTLAQQKYASTDAWVSYCIYKKLMETEIGDFTQ